MPGLTVACEAYVPSLINCSLLGYMPSLIYCSLFCPAGECSWETCSFMKGGRGGRSEGEQKRERLEERLRERGWRENCGPDVIFLIREEFFKKSTMLELARHLVRAFYSASQQTK